MESKFKKILDEVPIGVYVVERETYRILYINEIIKNNPQRPRIGQRCVDIWNGAESCKNCPTKKLIDGVTTYTEYGVKGLHGNYDITATETDWDGIPAYIITTPDHVLNDTEKITVNERDYLLKAALYIYPTIYFVNYTQNSYKLLSIDKNDIIFSNTSGTIEELVEYAVSRMHPNYKEGYRNNFMAANVLKRFESGINEIYYEHKLMMPDGSGTWVSSQIIRMDDNENGDIVAIALLRPIEEMKTVKEQSVEFVQGLSALYEECVIVNITNDTYVIRGSFGGIDEFSHIKNFSKFLDFGQTLVHPDDVEGFMNTFSLESLRKGVKNGAKQFQMQLRRNDISDDKMYHWVRMTGVVLESEEYNEQKIFIVTDNIDEYTTATIEQNNANLRFINTVSKTYDKVYECNLHKNLLTEWIITDNGAHTSSVSMPYDEKIAEICERSIHPDYQSVFLNTFCHDNILNAYENDMKGLSFETLRYIKNGDYRWCLIEIHFIKSLTNEIVFMYYIKDIDDSKREAEEKHQLLVDALNYAEKANSFKTDFLSRMSHDIRTPMNAIIGMTNIAADNIENYDKLNDCFGKINASAKYLLSLINDILDMSKIEQGKMAFIHEKFSIYDFMDNIYICCSAQANLKNQNLTIFVSDDIESEYIGDSLKLNQVLMNLLSNAMKFTRDGGDVTVNLNIREETQSIAVLRFEVEDNGIGMSYENIDKIFEPFEQISAHSGRQFEGSGLGLSIAKSIVHMMKGHISVKSEIGKGTLFIVDIPLERAERDKRSGVQSKKQTINVSNDYVFNGERILVAEDNEINMEIMINILEQKGFTYELAENGEEAVKLVAKNPEHYFQAVLMDIRMPIMDGLEATRQIRRLPALEYTKSLPIIAMTANAFYEEMEKAKQCGINEYLTKPIDLSLLTETMYRALYINNYSIEV